MHRHIVAPVTRSRETESGKKTAYPPAAINRSALRGPSVAALALGALVLVLAACGNSVPAASQSSTALKSTSIMMVLGSTNNAPVYLAQQKGYFKQYGLNVKIVNDTKGVSLANSALLGGSVDFVLDPLTSVMDLNAAGGKTTMIAEFGTGSAYQLIINPAKAKSLGISTSSTSSEVLRAFKRSHLKVAVVSPTSDPGLDLTYALNPLGIKNGTDYSFVYAGSQLNVVAAYDTGKADAIAGNPQLAFSVQGGTPVQVPFASFPGLTGTVYNGLITTDKLIQSDPTLVQDFVMAYVKAWNDVYKGTPAQIKQEMSGDYTSGGLTKAPAISAAYTLEDNNLMAARTPAITEASFQKTLALKNALNKQLSPPKAQYNDTLTDVVDNSFVDKALSALNLPYTRGG